MVSVSIPEHGKGLFSRAVIVDMVPCLWNCGLGFMTWMWHILKFVCTVEFVVLKSAIRVLTQVSTCMPVDTCVMNSLDAWTWWVLESWSMSAMSTWVYDMYKYDTLLDTQYWWYWPYWTGTLWNIPQQGGCQKVSVSASDKRENKIWKMIYKKIRERE